MADLPIAGLSFGQTPEMLKEAIAGSGLAHAALASNIANINTPNYHRLDVSFKDALAATEPTPPDPNELTLATDDPNHIGVNGEIPAQPFAVEPRIDESWLMRTDGSNVDLDQEMARLSQNSAYAQAMAQMLEVEYARVHNAIEERA
ncbi:MAG: flagellar basal body rod protein FlgB [Candidatus Eremiobacteraeota bacterium]|nr:flagellar basal body rod protein FlgB [Candidatus Eremiobacteraeota bacterium]MBV8355507.1 flagellar basal body rod protein FlgB [Candidatus Eremiobacteraeota bacterium]